MTNIANLLTEHIDIWTAAESEKKSGRGRASGNAGNVYGVKILRELILELAVRGKLVPQDPNNEPASEILKRIQAEKSKLIAEGKLKKEKPLQPIGDDEKTFELPLGWEWVRVGSLGDWGAGATPLRSISSYYGGSMPWFKSGELIADFIDTSEETVTELALKECSLRLNQPGDVLLAMYGATIGKASILKVAGTTNQAVCACTPNGCIFNRYLLLMLKAMKANFVGQGAGGAQPNISREKIIATLTALPPLPEQHRIVAKVDELMALCDQLEQQHSNAKEAHETLVSQLLATLTQSQNATEFNANWQRIYAHFDVLFTTEASIDALKQTLLQLAVMGKLVPQDPFDEPASELLKRIQAEKAKLIAEGKLKKEKPLAPISEDEKPFELPIGWSWIYFGDYSVIERGGSPRPIQDYITNEESGLNWIKISDTSVNSKYITSTQEKIRKEGLVKTRMVCPGDFLLTNSMSFGRPYITKIQGCIHDGWLRIHPSEVMDKDFLYQLLMSPYVYGAFTQSAAGAVVQNLNADKVRELKIPIPPLAEQHRIVAKVEALMALCDQLKTCIQQANQQQQLIADALVTQAVA
ncbi:restriction endonuclease subunit S [Methylotenera mobilis]|uniref:restriction endonuclease subunit S n=1 Tax=Methylotenera mobilis TaxID=359408 RepID=UPI00035DC48C|nr:restriction endonuclease subunit S [Methylotenera mobilis]